MHRQKVKPHFFNAFLNVITLHPPVSFFGGGGWGGSTQQPPTFLVCSCTWETEGCEGRVPTDRCPPRASGGNLSQQQVWSRGRCFRPQPNLSTRTKVCILEVVCVDVLLVFGVFLSSSRRTLILTSRSRLEIRTLRGGDGGQPEGLRAQKARRVVFSVRNSIQDFSIGKLSYHTISVGYQGLEEVFWTTDEMLPKI